MMWRRGRDSPPGFEQPTDSQSRPGPSGLASPVTDTPAIHTRGTMALQTHLQRRGGRYRVRVRAPRDLIAIIGHNEIVRALNTSDPQVARRQGARVSALIHQLFAR